MVRRNGKLWHTALVDRPLLVAFEGIDGAGKTTQVRMLTAALQSVGLEVVQSKEPTNGVHGRIIRNSAVSGRLPIDRELQAFIDDRREHVETLIQPALDLGKIVILDRYYYSTIAYQGARGKDVTEIREAVQKFAPVPDVVFLIDIDPALGLSRIAESRGETPNQFETIESLKDVRAVFNTLTDPNIAAIDGSQSIEVVHELVLTQFIEGPLKRKRCAKEYGCDDPSHCTPGLTGQCEWLNLTGRLRANLLEGTPS